MGRAAEEDCMGARDAIETLQVGLDEVLITEELARRPSGPRDRAAEADALAELAQVLADDPGAALDRLAEVARRLCRADSAGISAVEPGGAGSPALGEAPGATGCVETPLPGRVLAVGTVGRLALKRQPATIRVSVPAIRGRRYRVIP